MKKYEYKKVRPAAVMDGPSVSEDKLNIFGSEGWQLCYVTNWDGKPAFFYFMRETK